MNRHRACVVEALELRVLLAVAAVGVNFQPAAAAVSPGYVADVGLLFGDRGGGGEFGWNIDRRRTSRDHNAAASPDQRFDTSALLDGRRRRPAVWELAVPPGDYSVDLAAGDPRRPGGRYAVRVEGQPALAGRTSRADRWLTRSLDVTVTDGRLTLTADPGTRARINFIDVRPKDAATPPPPPEPTPEPPPEPQPPPAPGQPPAPPQAPPQPAPGTGLLAEYFDHPDLTGDSITRTDATVDFAWDVNAPDPSIDPESFSARWLGRLQPPHTGDYTFHTLSDDGVRLWVDGRLLIDHWTDHPPTEDASPAPVHLEAGREYDLRMEFYENTVTATARLMWSAPGLPKQVIPAAQLSPAADPTAPVRRAGRVRLEGRSLADDGGRFNALGATLMWGTWAYRHDRPRLERNLRLLSRNGFDYVRVLGVVGDVNAPDYWDGREADWRDPQYADTIAGLTDLAYDTYGLRVEWTLIGDGQKNIPDRDDRFRLVDTFLEMSRGREHKIIHFEIANEAWQNGFEGDAGVEQLRELTRYLNDRTDILVAASAGFDEAQTAQIYAGGVADLATVHFDRDVSKTEGHWRPVRQPWGHQFLAGLPVGSNNEPIGPGSSVNTETDPLRLVTSALVTHVSGLPLYVFHSNAGVRGDEDLANMPGVTNFRHLRQLVPADLASWTPKNAHWVDAPFRAYARNAAGALVPDTMWPDHPGASTGAVRVYAAVKDDQFFAVPFGIRGGLTLEPRRDAEFDVIDVMTGNVIEQKRLNAGQQFTLEGAEAFVLRGRFLQP